MDLPALQNDLRSACGLDLPATSSTDQLEELLAEKINAMILADFGGLVQLLYRIDVSESRLRQLLKAGAAVDAGRIVARLILERLWEKIQTRSKYNAATQKRRPDSGEEERW